MVNIRNSQPRVCDIRLGKDASFDAWWYTFLAENNMEYSINPVGVSSPDQIRFMVALDEDQIYVPCSDEVFGYVVEAHTSKSTPAPMLRWYAGAWRLAVGVVNTLAKNKEQRLRMLNFCKHRIRSSLALGNILPWRVVKRLMTTIMNLSQREDPWAEEKLTINKNMKAIVDSPVYTCALNTLPEDFGRGLGLAAMRRELDLLELSRLFYLAGQNRLQADTDFATLCGQAKKLLPYVQQLTGGAEAEPKTFLFVGDSEGNTLMVLELIKALFRQGHRIILALKSAPLFWHATIWDSNHDPVLAAALSEALFIHDTHISKNDLLEQLQKNRFVVINDGSSELLNLYRTSVSFARAWKECDAVIVNGWRQCTMLLGSSTEFTREIFCFWEERENHETSMAVKARSSKARRFGEADLTAQANAIISAMREARAEGKTVMFYSCIIGSLPGETATAIQLATAFIVHLRDRLDQVLVINPAEHFVEGMDADDLMFMWEKVQRSGLINTWRFQSVDDIEASFALMGRKVPPAWTGKDATYSTGCTKEMRIALDMQRQHPEMQIIGPALEKFFRRSEYGVGKFHDVNLARS